MPQCWAKSAATAYWSGAYCPLGEGNPAPIPASSLYVQKLANCISHKQLDKVYYNTIEAYCNLCREYPNRQYSQNMQKVINYILLNLSGELSPQSIAAAVNFSPGYVSHKFKEETGLTLMNYITQQRIRLAKKMLTDTDMSIRDIASYVGIPTILQKYSKKRPV